jgi:hypothetical protein
MLRRPITGAVMAVALLAPAGESPGIEVSATIQKVDAPQGVLVFTANGQERTARVAPNAKILDRDGKDLAGGLKSEVLKPGLGVTVTVEPEGGRPLVKGIRLGQAGAVAKKQAPPLPPLDTSALKALTDMGKDETYLGSKGGLYPGVTNERPEEHTRAGLELARTVRPLDPEGKPAYDGKIGLLAIGFSNTLQCFNGFMKLAPRDRDIDPRVVLVNGAQGGRSAFMIQSPDENTVARDYWQTWVADQLKARGVTPAQVQVVWLKETDANVGPEMLKAMGVAEYKSPLRQGFPEGARTLQGELERIVQVIHKRFPNVKLVFLSSRSYGGWAIREGNREPFSYETGYAVKWLIEKQLSGDPALNFDPAKGEVKAPWLSWGPYIWANGSVKRSDGFSFEKDDFREDDHMHHSTQGMIKMGQQLLQFFKSDPTTKVWFIRPGR